MASVRAFTSSCVSRLDLTSRIAFLSGALLLTDAAGARKLEEETETFKTQKAGLGLGKAIQAGRTAKKLTQKQLATSLNEKPQVIQQYENGQAIPNPQIIGKIERALGVKLPRPPKVQKPKD